MLLLLEDYMETKLMVNEMENDLLPSFMIQTRF